MADYSSYDPQVGQSDYPTKISGLITALGIDVTSVEGRATAIELITDFISVTQAVNLDTIESDTATNNAKVTNAAHTGEVTGSTGLTIANDAVTYAKMQNVVADDVLLGNIAGAGGSVAELTVANVITLLNTGSALDADTLDTVQGANYARIDVDNNYVGRQNFNDFSEEANSIATTGAVTLDTSLATYFYNTATTGIITFTFSNPAATGRVTSFTLELFGGGTNAPVWPASVRWPTASEPTWSTGKDIVSFVTRDNGANWHGFPGGFAFG